MYFCLIISQYRVFWLTYSQFCTYVQLFNLIAKSDYNVCGRENIIISSHCYTLFSSRIPVRETSVPRCETRHTSFIIF